MTYTVWMNGQQIGHTDFEFERDRWRRAGRFQPTEFGLQMLPAITDVAPALLDFGRLCERSGVDPTTATEAEAESAFERFADTPEGQRVMAAIHHVAALRVRDSHGHLVPWESILITDLHALAQCAKGDEQAGIAPVELDDFVMPVPEESLESAPVKFLISVTLSLPGQRRAPEPWRKKLGAPTC